MEDLYVDFHKIDAKFIKKDNLAVISNLMGIGGHLNAKDNNWVYSKYMCLKTIEVLLSGSETKRNEFITFAWLYAASNTDQSSFFIKISD